MTNGIESVRNLFFTATPPPCAGGVRGISARCPFVGVFLSVILGGEGFMLKAQDAAQAFEGIIEVHIGEICHSG